MERWGRGREGGREGGGGFLVYLRWGGGRGGAYLVCGTYNVCSKG